LLLRVRGVGAFEVVGGTLDDALGEAYDKAARQLGLPLGGGGGPAVEALARKGDGSKRPLPVPMLGKPGYDFSFSGLKNAFKLAHAAVRLERGLSLAPSAPQSPSQGDATGLFSEEDKKEMEEHHIRGYRLDGAAGAEREVPLPEQDKADLAASFQNAAIAHLEDRVGRAMVACDEEEEEGFGRTLVVVGGVAANQEVGRRLRELCARGGRRLPKSAKDREALANVRAWTLEVPCPAMCTDNGIMIAWTAVERIALGCSDDPNEVWVKPQWPIGELLLEANRSCIS